MMRYRLRSVRAILPTALERRRSRRTLRRTVWLDCAARMLFRARRCPLPVRDSALVDLQRELAFDALAPRDRRRHAGEVLRFFAYLRRKRLRPRELQSNHVVGWLAYSDATRTPQECIHAYTAVREILRLRNLFDPSTNRRVQMCLDGIRRKLKPRAVVEYNLARIRHRS